MNGETSAFDMSSLPNNGGERPGFGAEKGHAGPSVEEVVQSVCRVRSDEDERRVAAVVTSELDAQGQRALAIELASRFTDGEPQHFAATMVKAGLVRFTLLDTDLGGSSYCVSRLGFYAARQGDHTLMAMLVGQTASPAADTYLPEIGPETRGWSRSDNLLLAQTYLQLKNDIQAAGLDDHRPEEADVSGALQDFNNCVVDCFREKLYIGTLEADIINACADVNVALAEAMPDSDQICASVFGAHEFVQKINDFLGMQATYGRSGHASTEAANAATMALDRLAATICRQYPRAVAEAYLRGTFGYDSYRHLAYAGNTPVLEGMYRNISSDERKGPDGSVLVSSIIWSKFVNGESTKKLSKQLKKAVQKGDILEKDARTLESGMSHETLVRRQARK